MTYERYMELNALADRLIGSRTGITACDHAWINALSMRERKLLNSMVFRCLVCQQWFDCDLMHEQDKTTRKCIPCGSKKPFA